MLAGWLFDLGGGVSGFSAPASEREIRELSAKLAALESENATVKAELARLSRSGQIDSVAQADLATQLKQAQNENAKLKEELAFLQGMINGTQSNGLSIPILHLLKIQPGRYKYDFQVVFSGRGQAPFQGRYQLVIHGVRANKRESLVFPPDEVASAISFKSVYKTAGDVRLPEDFVPDSVELKLFATGTDRPKVVKKINLAD